MSGQLEQSFAEFDRVQAPDGQHKGKWFLSSRAVAKLFGVARNSVLNWKKLGVPWMVKKGQKPRFKGKQLTNRRKPVTCLIKHGPYGKLEYYWLEEEVQEFERARAKLGFDDGFVGRDGIKAFSTHPATIEYRRRKKMLHSEMQLAAASRKVNGRDVPYVFPRPAYEEDDLGRYQKLKTTAPAAITMRWVADVLKVSRAHVGRLVPPGMRRKEEVQVKCGKQTRVLNVYTIPEGKAKRLCNQRGIRWPHENGDGVSATDGRKHAAAVYDRDDPTAEPPTPICAPQPIPVYHVPNPNGNLRKYGPNLPRDKAIYEWREKRKTFKEILDELQRRPKWDLITRESGVAEAGKRYANFHGLPWPI